ncbi:MAG: methyl-accepting chemotaxis protein [Burkholderiaceae bacterium]
MLRIIGQFSIGQRLACLAVISIALTAVPTALYGLSSWQLLRANQYTATGIQPVADLLDVIRLTQQHRGMTAVVLAGNSEVSSRREQKSRDASAAYEKLTNSIKSASNSSEFFSKWDGHHKRWKSISDQVSRNSLSRKESFEIHNKQVRELIETLAGLDVEFDLSHIAEPAFGETMHAVLYSIPLIGDAMGKARAQGSAALNATGQRATTSERVNITALLSIAQSHMSAIGDQYEIVLQENPTLQSALLEKLRKTRLLASKALALSESEILGIDAMRLSPNAHFRTYSEAIDSQFELSLLALESLNTVLKKRIQSDEVQLFSVAVVMGLFILFGFGAGIAIAHSIVRQLGGEPREVVAMANAVSSGKLAAGPEFIHAQQADKNGESIAAAMARMRESLFEIVTDVRQCSTEISAGGNQLLAANQELNSKTIEHADHLQETAAAVVQITETVRQTSEAVATATRLAGSANDAATEGGEVVQQVYDTMLTIKDSASRIQNIITVVDEIAFQTNILALNAAVEAARAGELGRGFAVVATEVRSLALRSSEAAQQVRSLIEESVENVATGSKLTDRAESSTRTTVEQVRSVSELLVDIANASDEQTQGIARIGVAMNSIEDTTQRNIAMVGESTTSTELLSQQASRLNSIVARFRLEA